MGKLLIWTYSHFAVDFGCFYILFAGLKSYVGSDLQTLAAGFLTYNVIAFGLQSLIGMMCDAKPQIARDSGFTGAAMVFLAVLMAAAGHGTDTVWFAMTICALGNAFFHVGGGVNVLRTSGGRMTPNGIFVSSGAMGVALGSLCESGIIAFVLIFAAVLLTGLLQKLEIRDAKMTEHGLSAKTASLYIPFDIANDGKFIVLVGLLMAAVFVRSYAGSIMPSEWEKDGWLVVLPAAASCLGKALGGMAGDRFGGARTGVMSLIVSVPFVCLGAGNMVLSLAGILLFNMTMPITLCGLASLMPENLGFAFGLTTLALLIGVGITYFTVLPAAFVKPVVAVLIICAAVCIGFSVNNKMEEKR